MADAMRAEWYDLDESGTADYLAWLHGAHLPRLQALPGISWIGHYRIAEKQGSAVAGSTHARRETTDSVAPGRAFLLLTAAPADILLKPDPELAALDAEPRLTERRNWREAVFVEETRVAGPEALHHKRDKVAPPAMQLGNFVTVSPAAERELAGYYRRHRFLQVEKTPGCIGLRKMVSSVGWPKHGILYEFTDMKDGDSLFEARMNAAIPDMRWAGTHPLELVVHAPHAPHAGRRIWPPV